MQFFSRIYKYNFLFGFWRSVIELFAMSGFRTVRSSPDFFGVLDFGIAAKQLPRKHDQCFGIEELINFVEWNLLAPHLIL